MIWKITLLSICMFFSVQLMAEEVDTTKTVRISEITVQASRMDIKMKNIPQKIEIIPSLLILSTPADNLADLIKRNTNIDVVQYPGLYATAGMRGFSPTAVSRSYTLLLINGKPAGTTNLASINPDNIEQIEVVKGPYSVLYGSDAMGGVINIITKSAGDHPEGSAVVETGSFGYQKLSGNFTGKFNKKMTYGLGYSHMQQNKDYRIGRKNLLKITDKDVSILDKSSYGDAMDNSQYEMNLANSYLNFKFNDHWKVSAEIMYTFANDVEVPSNYWGSYGDTKKDISRINLYSNLEYNNCNNTIKFSPYYTNELNPFYSDNSDKSFVNFKTLEKEYGYQLQNSYRIGKVILLTGSDFKVYDYHSDAFSSNSIPSNPYRPDNRNTNFALFTQGAYSTEKLSVNAGIRYDYYAYHIDSHPGIMAEEANASYNTLNPSVGAQYFLSKNLKAHASFGTAFSVPDAYKVAGLYTVWGSSYIGNPDLKPEKAKSADLGISISSPEKGLSLDVTYFNTIHDLKIVEESLAPGKFTYVNANDSKMSGLELMSSFKLGSLFANKFDLEVYANFTWMLHNSFTQGSGVDLIEREMSYVHKSNGNFGLILQGFEKINMRLNGRYIGTRLETDYFLGQRIPITPINYYTKGGYKTADVVLQHPASIVFDYNISYDFSNRINFGISVANLMDENYSEKDGYNMPGRSIIARFVYSLE